MWLCPEIALHSSTRGPIFGTPNVPCKTWAKPPEMPCMKRGEPHFMPRMSGPIFGSDHCWRANVFCLPKLGARHHFVLPENGFFWGRAPKMPPIIGGAPRRIWGLPPKLPLQIGGTPHIFGYHGWVRPTILCPGPLVASTVGRAPQMLAPQHFLRALFAPQIGACLQKSPPIIGGAPHTFGSAGGSKNIRPACIPAWLKWVHDMSRRYCPLIPKVLAKRLAF